MNARFLVLSTLIACTNAPQIMESENEVSVGTYFSCATSSATGVWCWGPEGSLIQLSDDTAVENGRWYVPEGEILHSMANNQLLYALREGTLTGYGESPLEIADGVAALRGAWFEDADGGLRSLRSASDTEEPVSVWGAWKGRLCLQRGSAAIQCPFEDPNGMGLADWDLAGSAGVAWSSLDVGPDGVCALDAKGRLDCFGPPGSLSELAPRHTSKGAKFPRYVKVFSWEGGAGCALEADGTPTCWGGDAPAWLQGAGWVELDAQDHTVCAINLEGSVQCFGDNAWGEGEPTARPEP